MYFNYPITFQHPPKHHGRLRFLTLTLLFTEAKHNNNITKMKNNHDKTSATLYNLSLSNSSKFLPSFYIKLMSFSFPPVRSFFHFPSCYFSLICKLQFILKHTYPFMVTLISFVIHPLKEATFGTNLTIIIITINFTVHN